MSSTRIVYPSFEGIALYMPQHKSRQQTHKGRSSKVTMATWQKPTTKHLTTMVQETSAWNEYWYFVLNLMNELSPVVLNFI